MKNCSDVFKTITGVLFVSIILAACGTSDDSDLFSELDFPLELKSDGILSLEINGEEYGFQTIVRKSDFVDNSQYRVEQSSLSRLNLNILLDKRDTEQNQSDRIQFSIMLLDSLAIDTGTYTIDKEDDDNENLVQFAIDKSDHGSDIVHFESFSFNSNSGTLTILQNDNSRIAGEFRLDMDLRRGLIGEGDDVEELNFEENAIFIEGRFDVQMD